MTQQVNAPKNMSRHCKVAANAYCADTNPGSTFFALCGPYKFCAAGELDVASSAGDSGQIGLSFSFVTTGKPVNLRVPWYMTCSYTDVYNNSDTVSATRIKKAVYLNCYWYVTEQLQG
jgi:hypothetical protein